MKVRDYVLITAVLFCPALARAQDFGVMESAETIDKGNFKIKANPLLVFQDGDNEVGVTIGAGYGFTDSFDFEGKLAFYENSTIIGGDVEFWLVKRPRPVDVSVYAGFHYRNVEVSDSTGVDVGFIVSRALTPKLDVYGAIDAAFNYYTDDLPDRTFNQVHFVPGVEYKIHRDLDIVAEFGIGLNKASDHYISGGVAYYIR